MSGEPFVYFIRPVGMEGPVKIGYRRSRFRYLDLPESITSCLNAKSLDAPNELEPAR